MAQAGSGAERVNRRRGKLRAEGLRPVQLWVTDTRTPEAAAECARQAERIRDAELGAGLRDDWSDSSDTTGWTV